MGDPPVEGKGQGMAQMFQMMNEERTVTGLAALSAATVSYNNAAMYAAGRIQGRQITNPKAARVSIIHHEDVRRMLMYQKSITEASRAMIAMSYYALDIAENTTDENERKRAKAFVEVNIRIVKLVFGHGVPQHFRGDAMLWRLWILRGLPDRAAA